ncbi:unnamed protein product [Chrysodeixis includens]|uniref:Peptidase S1 domain-containing protein n=1 Tax=Chrysodeixis includens TaxID=689277 RepID=A0A9P0FWA3_CHRIL|nr:unnamed protein product [Chrysodeixis includens]
MKTCALILSFVAVATAAVVTSPFDIGVYDYHNRIGIPEASRILKLENEIIQGQSRIVGGSTTTIEAVPYLAGLLITIGLSSISMCGGSVISDTRILTAAHCYNDGNNIARAITIVLGSNYLISGGTRVNSVDVVTHPTYNPRTITGDIAVIRIEKITFLSTIQPVNLPGGPDAWSSIAIASGYGITRDGESASLVQVIRSVPLHPISNNLCRLVYGSLIKDDHLCTDGWAGRGICGGDTGGPLVFERDNETFLLGVGSFVSARGCEALQHSGFTRVATFEDWIRSLM